MGTDIIVVFTFFVMSLIAIFAIARGLQKTITTQQKQIDDLKRKLEEMERQLNQKT